MTTPTTTVTRADALRSASLFVARVWTQYLVAQLLAKGALDMIYDAIAWTAPTQVVGWVTLAITGLLIFWGQFGYQLSQDAGWKWAANLKWPF